MHAKFQVKTLSPFIKFRGIKIQPSYMQVYMCMHVIGLLSDMSLNL